MINKPSYISNAERYCKLWTEFQEDENRATEIMKSNKRRTKSKMYEKYSNTWSKLPSLCIENIYTYLSRNDQYHMSLVCKHWSNEFGSSSIWKTIKFYLPERKYASEIYPEVRFARKYGSMFRHVEIICRKVKFLLMEEMFQQLNLFLYSLTTTSHLESVKFINLKKYLLPMKNCIHLKVVSTIEMFLKSQKKLESVDFIDSSFTENDCIKLLLATFKNKTCKLKRLTLKGFVQDSEADIDVSDSDIHLICDNIFGLEKLETNHTKLFERILNHCGKMAIPVAAGTPNTVINIIAKGSNHRYLRGISDLVWKQICSNYPKLRTDIHFSPNSDPLAEMEFFIVPDMPLRRCEAQFDRGHTFRMSINIFLNHILTCRLNETLESLGIIWKDSIPRFADVIIPFVRHCRKLKFLNICAQYPVYGIVEVLKSFLTHKPTSLIFFNLIVVHVQTEEEYSALCNLAQQYTPLLKEIGLELNLIAEPTYRRWRN